MLFGNSRNASSLRDCIFPEKLPPAVNTKRKNPGRTVIAHISDLHFTAETNSEAGSWVKLLEDLTTNYGNSVDVLAVTGDLIDASLMDFFTSYLPKSVATNAIEEAFARVFTYLGRLCEALNINPQEGLVVVPGNHDYRAKGIFRSKRLPQKFYEQFQNQCRPILLPDLHLCMFVLDSNTMRSRSDLATGLIESDDMARFRSLVARTRAQHLNCTKVVLLHHHPMPIPAIEAAQAEYHPWFSFIKRAQKNPGLTLLKNAGQFMRLMVEARVNLVLHGHEHHPAFSKAYYPGHLAQENKDAQEEYSITIVGAGSAGVKVENYNLITIVDGGVMTLERRSLKEGIYRYEYGTDLGTYAEMRRSAFERLAEKAGAEIRARKCSELYVIKSVSGDANVYERYEGVRAFGEDKAKRTVPVESEAGFFANPKIENVVPPTQSIRSEWNSAPVTAEMKQSFIRLADIVYDPPLRKDPPIESYEVEHKAYNLFHFTRQDRLDMTDGRSGQELYQAAFKNAYELYVLTLCFPEGNFPDKFYREVHGPGCYDAPDHHNCVGTRDRLEEEFFNLHFSKFKDAHTVVVSIERPLPRYTYRLKWDLPDEDKELSLPPIAQGFADKLVRALLSLREPDSPHQAKVQAWFKDLRDSIVNSKLWASLGNGSSESDIYLYAYNKETNDWKKRGLVCVASTRPGMVAGEDPEEVIKPGKTLIGATYRRKEPMTYSPLRRGLDSDRAEYEDRIPATWRKNADGDTYRVVCALPLFYPIRANQRGRKVAVLAFASKDPTSKLLNFVRRPEAPLSSEEREELAKKRNSLEYFVMTTKFRELARALGVEPPEDPAPNQPIGGICSPPCP